MKRELQAEVIIHKQLKTLDSVRRFTTHRERLELAKELAENAVKLMLEFCSKRSESFWKDILRLVKNYQPSTEMPHAWQVTKTTKLCSKSSVQDYSCLLSCEGMAIEFLCDQADSLDLIVSEDMHSAFSEGTYPKIKIQIEKIDL